MREEASSTERQAAETPSLCARVTDKVVPKAGRRRRLTRELLEPLPGGLVERDGRVPAVESAAFIQDAGRRRASIPYGPRPGHADSAVRGARPADPRLALLRCPGRVMS